MAPPTGAPAEKIPWAKREQTLNQVKNWRVEGKIAVNTAQDAGSATLQWSQQQNRYRISLFGPLGANHLSLYGQPNHVVLIASNGKRYTAGSPEQLLAQQWGFHVPVSNLVYWIRGLPVPSIPYQSQLDPYNRLATLHQAGWVIHFSDYTRARGVDLPTRIFAKSRTLSTKMLIYRWQLG